MYVLLQSTESDEVLGIHPRVLCFHFGANVSSSCCVLYLTNKSKDRYVGFWIETQQGIIDCTYDGTNIVDPDTTKAVTVELHSVIREYYLPEVPVDTGRINILTATMTKEEKEEVCDAINANGPSSFGEEIRSALVQILGREVHEALLAVVVCPLSSQKRVRVCHIVLVIRCS